MSLDVVQVAGQIEEIAGELKASQEARKEQIQFALNTLRSPATELTSLKEKIAASSTTWLVAEPMNRLDLASKAPPPPSEFSVIAADGSHIDVDRHSPVRCYLINIGSVSLRYGKGSGAFLASEPTLYSGDDLTIADPTGYSQEVPIEGPLLGIKRSVLECRKLAELAQDLNEDTPALGLLDGSLILSV